MLAINAGQQRARLDRTAGRDKRPGLLILYTCTHTHTTHTHSHTHEHTHAHTHTYTYTHPGAVLPKTYRVLLLI